MFQREKEFGNGDGALHFSPLPIVPHFTGKTKEIPTEERSEERGDGVPLVILCIFRRAWDEFFWQHQSPSLNKGDFCLIG